MKRADISELYGILQMMMSYEQWTLTKRLYNFAL